MGNFVDSWELTLLDPDMIREMATTHNDKYIKYKFAIYPFADVFGWNLLLAEGKEWKK